jgi:hypothetical protein
MKNIFSFLLNNWDVITTLLLAIITRSLEKPLIEKQAKIKILDDVVEESLTGDEDGRSRSISEIVVSVLNSLKSKKNVN